MITQETTSPLEDQQVRMERKPSRSSRSDSIEKVDPTNVGAEVQVSDPEKATTSVLHDEDEEDMSTLTKLYRRGRPFVLVALAALILGWWVSSTVLKATRHRWCARSSAFFSIVTRDSRAPPVTPPGSSRLSGPGSSSCKSHLLCGDVREGRARCISFVRDGLEGCLWSCAASAGDESSVVRSLRWSVTHEWTLAPRPPSPASFSR